MRKPQAWERCEYRYACPPRCRMQRSLIAIGSLLVVAGMLWPWLSQLPLGRLPGDIVVDKPGFKLYVPITTMLLLSVLLSGFLWLFRR